MHNKKLPPKDLRLDKRRTDKPFIKTMADSVRCAHLLIKHTGSRNPVSRRTGQEVTLRPQEALTELKSYQAKILHEGVHEAFPKYARQRSDW